LWVKLLPSARAEDKSGEQETKEGREGGRVTKGAKGTLERKAKRDQVN